MKHEVRVVRRRRGPVVKYYVIQVKDNGTWIDANPGVAGKKHNGYRDLNEALKQVWKYDGSEPEDEVVWTSDGVSDVNVMPIMVCYLSPGERFSVESEYYILTENGAVNLRDGSAHYFAPHEIVYRRRYIDDCTAGYKAPCDCREHDYHIVRGRPNEAEGELT